MCQWECLGYIDSVNAGRIAAGSFLSVVSVLALVCLGLFIGCCLPKYVFEKRKSCWLR